jgi:membrane-bound lytic murein transglycosylase B
MLRRTLLAAAVTAAFTAPSLVAPGRIAPSLITPAWENRRNASFRTKPLAKPRILDHGEASPARMTGSDAGALRGRYE